MNLNIELTNEEFDWIISALETDVECANNDLKNFVPGDEDYVATEGSRDFAQSIINKLQGAK